MKCTLICGIEWVKKIWSDCSEGTQEQGGNNSQTKGRMKTSEDCFWDLWQNLRFIFGKFWRLYVQIQELSWHRLKQVLEHPWGLFLSTKVMATLNLSWGQFLGQKFGSNSFLLHKLLKLLKYILRWSSEIKYSELWRRWAIFNKVCWIACISGSYRSEKEWQSGSYRTVSE